MANGEHDPLIKFLRACITKDKAMALTSLFWIDADRTDYAKQLARKTGPYSTVVSASFGGQDMGPSGTVETSPGRLLAECEAKRLIVELHRSVKIGDDEPYCADDGELPPCPTLRALALPYADRPGYREEWKP